MLSLLTGLLPMQDDPVAALGGQVNMLWVVIGAILVIFMQAGFALVETGFCRAKHAAHVVSTNFAIFGLGFIAFFFVGFPLSLSALDMTGYFGGLGAAVGSPLIGDGNWIFLFKGGWALSGGGIDAGVLALFLYMVAFMDTVATIPTGVDGRALEVGQLRDLGPLLRRHLLPAVRSVDVGRGLAVEDVGHDGPRCRLRRLRRIRCRAHRRRRRRTRRSDRHRPAHRQVRQGRHTPRLSRVTTSRWRCSARSSCCSVGSGSTPRRRSPPPTCSSRSWPRTRPSPAPSGPSWRCSGSPSGPASRTLA